MRPDATGKPFYIDYIFNLDIYFSNFEFYACLRRGVMGAFHIFNYIEIQDICRKMGANS